MILCFRHPQIALEYMEFLVTPIAMISGEGKSN